MISVIKDGELVDVLTWHDFSEIIHHCKKYGDISMFAELLFRPLNIKNRDLQDAVDLMLNGLKNDKSSYDDETYKFLKKLLNKFKTLYLDT